MRIIVVKSQGDVTLNDLDAEGSLFLNAASDVKLMGESRAKNVLIPRANSVIAGKNGFACYGKLQGEFINAWVKDGDINNTRI